jgi:hypothetical protein
MESLVARQIMELDVHIGIHGAQGEDCRVEITEWRAIHMRQTHGSGHARPLAGNGLNVEHTVAHLGCLAE